MMKGPWPSQDRAPAFGAGGPGFKSRRARQYIPWRFRELMFELGSDFNWFEKVSVEALSDDIRRSILRFIKDKLGFK